MKNKMANKKRGHVAAAYIDSNTKFKLSDGLNEDLLKAVSNFKRAIKFHNKDFSANKPRQNEEVRKEIVKNNERYVKYFEQVSLLLFPSEMDDDEKIRLFEE